ncbi:MAG: AEC family transporter [Granulosicoccus sp.]|nr:AEC family transporter [Granulosicoccus sp.]
MNTLVSLLPDFGIIAVGALIGSRIALASWLQIDKLCYYLFYPALLFAAASQRPIAAEALVQTGLLACAIVTAGFLLVLCAGSLSRGYSRSTRAGVSQNAWRFNTALGFVAVSALPAEAASVLAIIVGLAIPLANLYAVLAMTREQSDSRWRRLSEIALNPFLLASLAGITVGLVGKPLPPMASAFVNRLADAAIPVVLLSLGAALRQFRIWPPDRYALAIIGIKLLALPALVGSVVLLGDYRGILPATLLIFSALPTASAAHVLAARYGADRSQVATVVMQSTTMGLLTLPLWTALALRIAGV